MAKQVHPAKRLLKVIVAVLLVTLVFGSLAQAAPLVNQTIDNVNYAMFLNPQDAKLCVGQTVVFQVSVRLIVTEHVGNQAPYDYRVYYSNEEIKTTVLNENVGTIAPTRLRTSVALNGGYDPEDLAPLIDQRIERRPTHSPILVGFTFTAKERGVTTITFEHTGSAKPIARALPLNAQVEVVDCWEAYATGLWTGNKSNVWTKKDICNLERPFVLEGNGESDAFGTRTIAKSRAYFFWPSRAPFGVLGLTGLQDGRYIYVGLSTVISPDGTSASCTSVGSGSYQQFIYESRTPLEGNIILYGSIDTYCEGASFHTANDGIQVAFRALGVGQACQESLP